ncbi:MAG: hypothetical protein JWP69_2306 [Flaviaesturariibacter sp.]|nr:hypothetical protein [Flaviaesturariibacter sp.]
MFKAQVSGAFRPKQNPSRGARKDKSLTDLSFPWGQGALPQHHLPVRVKPDKDEEKYREGDQCRSTVANKW